MADTHFLRSKRWWLIAGVIVVVALAASVKFPLAEIHQSHCLYCGYESALVRVLGLPVWRKGREVPEERVLIPEHRHGMVALCGSQWWAFRWNETWDNFGWTVESCREALIAGIRASPERKTHIMTEFLALDPDDSAAVQRFIKAYKPAKQTAPSPAVPG
ncbi:MAG: hypothetical protein V4710_08445 [Verrucomicrobiota bacterium]